jgi:hypothetical protein|eukprot:SAG25_NODE_2260_length_1775_cov_1.842482_3_plen_74_part_00
MRAVKIFTSCTEILPLLMISLFRSARSFASKRELIQDQLADLAGNLPASKGCKVVLEGDQDEHGGLLDGDQSD